ncbi:DUF3942 family protein [Bacillus cereus]|uniref:DUF3942 domain-containing protein n=2 Tax=Bacillus thuringiensis TaxID=1428 RepID=A0A643MFE6_BACTU|nr:MULTISPECIES: DUF3942 family protein [Bacillus cereus group]MCU5010014.1 DUF3942 family protein [Bacillus cereus]AHZ54031.1 Phage protein [Bacillus thuringiensis serovar kurstaki str. YBT-1520]AIM29140.1 hypothetical protein DF16_orf00724 [Bacillus thuringiensis serovar kurstaki str. YBT-1520]KAB1358090.1 DUF3942 domain-containing protein [Bacillus thuringiensis]KAB1358387.1 DUF3942 domain-containing protein [Bacillus thuringiensis]
MSNLEQTISKLKTYVGEDSEEKVLMEKFAELYPAIEKIRNEFPKPSKKEYSIINLPDDKYIKIESTLLRISINKEKNVIDVEKHHGIDVTKLEEIVLQDNELYCTKRGVIFTEDVFNEFLKEVFVEILG